jgi:DNA-binding SARP family transcriptional activator
MHRDRPIARESLATVLWEDCTPEHSKQYLRKALWQIENSFAFANRANPRFLQADAHWVSLNPNADLWLDVAEFERALAVAPESVSSRHSLTVWQSAIDIYRGDLLEGWYQDWCLSERERFQNIYLTILRKLTTQCEICHEYTEGIECATRILRTDPAHETAYQNLMRMHYLSGDRAGALRQFRHCVAALKRELGVQPSAYTREIYQQICEDSLLSAASGTSDELQGHNLTLLPSEVSCRLREVKATLTSLQNATAEALLRVEAALKAATRGPTTQNKTRF